MTKIKTGIGYDIHRFVLGRKLILGGITIPYHKGLQGHSDADVLFHAIADALLGAIGEKNIGEIFPDTADWTTNMDSKKIMEYVRNLVKKSNYHISNIDAVIIAQEPKLSPFLIEMRSSIANILEINLSDVGLKAKTNETLGDIGKGEAIAVMANVLIASNS